jgi:hypothetical protein
VICPNCKAEYREGFTRCADCDLPLVETLGEHHEPIGDELEPLHDTGSPDELGELVERLEDARVPYLLHAGTALALFDGEELREASQPDPWQARVFVSAPLHERSQQLLAELRAERTAGFAIVRRSNEPPPE